MARITTFDSDIAPIRVAEELLDLSSTILIGGEDTLKVTIPMSGSTSDGHDSELLLAPVQTEGDNRGGVGGGLRSLLGQIVRSELLEGRIASMGLTVSLPNHVTEWFRRHKLAIRVLAAAFESDPPDVSISDAESLSGKSAWLLQYERDDHTPFFRMIVQESKAGDGGSPSSALGRHITRQRDLLSLLVGEPVNLRSRVIHPDAIDWGRRLPTFTTENHIAIIHPPSLQRFLRRISDRSNRENLPFPLSSSDEQLIDLTILDAIVRRRGLPDLILSAPVNGTERRARFAIRTCVELARAGGIVTRTLADESYRNSAAYDRALAIVLGFGKDDLDVLRRAYGPSRWSQIERHAAYRRSGSHYLPWNRFISACESLCSELADRSRRPGYAPPSPVVDLVNRYYRAPRGTILKQVWQRQIDGGALHAALDQARLSILRGYLRAIPRHVLLRAAIGETPFVRERLSSAFGRRGRRLFDEDLLALENKLHRKELDDWEALLAARATVYSAARRA